MVAITDWNDLDSVRNDLTGSHTLENDLNSGTAGYDTVVDPAGATFEPLSEPFSQGPFEGSFNGKGNVIADLVIDKNRDALGLFGTINEGGSVSNLFVDATVTQPTGNVRAAVIAGFLRSGSINNCAATGSVDGVDQVGGVVARSDDTVTDCYSLADCSGDDRVGGFVGRNSTAERCFSAGSVSGGTNVGGFCGAAGTENDCYWDTNTSGQSTSAGGAVGLTTSEMQGSSASTNLSGFDFSSAWETVNEGDGDAKADGYAILQTITRVGQVDAQGLTPESGIIVGSTEYDCLVDGTRYDVVRN